MRALFWSAVINGIVAVPVMVTIMLISADRRVMGPFPIAGALRLMGWAATAAMALATAGFFYWSIASDV
jgi:Mn2+/Fe2+ NRAMP family transporter